MTIRIWEKLEFKRKTDPTSRSSSERGALSEIRPSENSSLSTRPVVMLSEEEGTNEL